VADERPQYQHGTGTIGGIPFHWGSGTPGKYWSVPYGDYPVTPDAPTGDWAHRVGAIPIANNVIADPQLGRNRIGIMIHSGSAPDLDTLYTQGCFKVAPEEWPAVRSEILKEASNGPLYLHVAPGGVAAFTNTKTLSQAGEQTPAANANAVANTSAPPSGALAKANYSFALPANAPMGMGNNNPLNIKYYRGAEKSYPGLIGPSSNTDQGDPQMKFESPEAGWNAAYSLLNKKYSNGMTTPNQIIAGKGGWTPGNTAAAANVAKSMGIGPDDDIGFSNSARAQAFMRALVTQEQGTAGKAYPDEMIARAVGGNYSSPPSGTVTLNTTPPHTLTPPTAGAPYTPEAVAAANPPAAAQPPQNIGDWLKKIAAKPVTKDAQGNEVQGKSPLESIASSFAKPANQQAPAIPEMQQAMPGQDPTAQLAGPASQLFQTVSQTAAKPLTWSSRPYGWDAGQQFGAPGATLNTTGYGYG
jgi:hypothetical protein